MKTSDEKFASIMITNCLSLWRDERHDVGRKSIQIPAEDVRGLRVEVELVLVEDKPIAADAPSPSSITVDMLEIGPTRVTGKSDGES